MLNLCGPVVLISCSELEPAINEVGFVSFRTVKTRTSLVFNLRWNREYHLDYSHLETTKGSTDYDIEE
jgi:hypothetical protein